jgi:hypothetical protein
MAAKPSGNAARSRIDDPHTRDRFLFALPHSKALSHGIPQRAAQRLQRAAFVLLAVAMAIAMGATIHWAAERL